MDIHVFLFPLQKLQIKLHLYVPDRKYDQRYQHYEKPRIEFNNRGIRNMSEVVLGYKNVHFDAFVVQYEGFGNSMGVSLYFPDRPGDWDTGFSQFFKSIRIPSMLAMLQRLRFRKRDRKKYGYTFFDWLDDLAKRRNQA